jgi:hypothetical protein
MFLMFFSYRTAVAIDIDAGCLSSGKKSILVQTDLGEASTISEDLASHVASAATS